MGGGSPMEKTEVCDLLSGTKSQVFKNIVLKCI